MTSLGKTVADTVLPEHFGLPNYGLINPDHCSENELHWITPRAGAGRHGADVLHDARLVTEGDNH